MKTALTADMECIYRDPCGCELIVYREECEECHEFKMCPLHQAAPDLLVATNRAIVSLQSGLPGTARGLLVNAVCDVIEKGGDVPAIAVASRSPQRPTRRQIP